MRSRVRSIGIMLAVLTFAGIQNASAQTMVTVEFTTSFPFTVGNSTVPAGTYTIKPDIDNLQILELTGKSATVLFEVEVAHAQHMHSETELVFSRYGNSYVLKSIWVEGLDSGSETIPGEGERHVAKSADDKSEHRVAARRTRGQ